jgi:hypothetical protein
MITRNFVEKVTVAMISPIDRTSVYQGIDDVADCQQPAWLATLLEPTTAAGDGEGRSSSSTCVSSGCNISR